jgi:predicted transposase YbfD/YdcC
MTICAVVAECEAWFQIFHYCKTKEKWFKEVVGLKLEFGIPSHDTFQRVFQLLDPKQLQKHFSMWINETRTNLCKEEFVNIDGKTVCGSRDDNKKTVHMVSAWANRNNLVLGQVKTDEKSNEITAIPELLDMIDVKDCVVTIDAMGCQKKISEKIVQKGAEYVFALKGNQPDLHDLAKDYFKDALGESNRICLTEKKHGRLEQRTYCLCTDVHWLGAKGWCNLNGLGMVSSRVETKDKVNFERRYYITSLKEIEKFATATRSHWGIENSLHWVLDVGFNEDSCRTRKDNSGENFAVIRHIALNLLKQDNSKMSMRLKRHRCAYDDEYLHHIIFNSELSI